jgi:thioredoxin
MNTYIRTISVLTFLVLLNACSGKQAERTTLDAVEFSEKINENPNALVLDVRTAEEFSEGHLKNAVNADINSPLFDNMSKEWNKNHPVFVYCLAGSRSSSAAARLSESGFKEIYELQGGYRNWKKADLPIETGAGSDKPKSMTMDEFNILVNKDVPVLVDFSAEWCAPCRKVKPMLEELHRKRNGSFKLIQIDIDIHDQLSDQIGIDVIPTLILYKGGKENWRHSGIIDETEFVRSTGL